MEQRLVDKTGDAVKRILSNSQAATLPDAPPAASAAYFLPPLTLETLPVAPTSAGSGDQGDTVIFYSPAQARDDQGRWVDEGKGSSHRIMTMDRPHTYLHLGIDMQPVHSSNVAAVGYDSENRILQVAFHSGHVYQYFDVEPEIHSQIMAAESKGKALHQLVKKPAYEYDMVTGQHKLVALPDTQIVPPVITRTVISRQQYEASRDMYGMISEMLTQQGNPVPTLEEYLTKLGVAPNATVIPDAPPPGSPAPPLPDLTNVGASDMYLMAALGVGVSKMATTGIAQYVTPILKDMYEKGMPMPRVVNTEDAHDPDTLATFYEISDAIFVNTGAPFWTETSDQRVRMVGKNHAAGFWATGEPGQPIVHEMGHYLHRVYMRQINERYPDKSWGNGGQQVTAMRVSRYAAYDPMEFVAETFSGLYSGKTYDVDVMKLYRRYHGPPTTWTEGQATYSKNIPTMQKFLALFGFGQPHDVTGEARDPHGRWTAGANSAGAQPPLIRPQVPAPAGLAPLANPSVVAAEAFQSFVGKKEDLTALYQGWADNLPEESYGPLMDYQSGSYKAINGYLRHGVDPTYQPFDEQSAVDAYQANAPDAEGMTLREYVRTKEAAWETAHPWTDLAYDNMGDELANLDQAVLTAPAPVAMTVWRSGSIGDMPLQPGDHLRDQGYVSTSADPSTAKGYEDQKHVAFYQIDIPKGAPAAFLDAHDDQSENEVLLMRDSEFQYLGMVPSAMTSGSRKAHQIESAAALAALVGPGNGAHPELASQPIPHDLIPHFLYLGPKKRSTQVAQFHIWKDTVWFGRDPKAPKTGPALDPHPIDRFTWVPGDVVKTGENTPVPTPAPKPAQFAAHDVSGEARDDHGKWTAGASSSGGAGLVGKTPMTDKQAVALIDGYQREGYSANIPERSLVTEIYGPDDTMVGIVSSAYPNGEYGASVTGHPDRKFPSRVQALAYVMDTSYMDRTVDAAPYTVPGANGKPRARFIGTVEEAVGIAKGLGVELDLTASKDPTVAQEMAALVVPALRDISAMGLPLPQRIESDKDTLRDSAVAGYVGAFDTIYLNPRSEFWHPMRQAEFVQRQEASGWWSYGDPVATVYHEIGHEVQYKNMDPEVYAGQDWQSMTGLGRETAVTVSRYAASSPHEFVAETFAGLMVGKTYGVRVMALYKAKQGVLPKGVGVTA